MRKYIWQIIAALLLVGLVFTSISWSNEQKRAETAQTALELAFDSAYTSGYFSLVNLESILNDTVAQGSYSITRPDMNLTFFAHGLRASVNQAQFSEHLANRDTDFFFAPIASPASQLISLMLSIDAELSKDGSRLSSEEQQLLSQVTDSVSQLKAAWQVAKEPSISREGLGDDEIYLDEAEANQIAQQIRDANGLMEQLLNLLK